MIEDELSTARVGVMAALANGDTGLAYRLVLGLLDDGHPFPVILEEVLAPIQWESGRRWELGDHSIGEEHASTAAIETLIALLTGSFEQQPDATLVVVVCAEGELHTLPARMAAALLVYDGFWTIFLGTSLPADDLGTFLAGNEPDVLVVSCTRPANLPGARACIAAGHRAGVPVVVGGRAFGESAARATALGADAHAPRLAALVEIIEGLQPDPAAAERAVTVGADAPVIDPSTRLASVAQLTHSITEAQDRADGSSRMIVECAGDLFDTMATAVYLGDDQLLADQAHWLSHLLERHVHVSVPAAQLLAWLAASLGDAVPEAPPVIASAIAALPSGS